MFEGVTVALVTPFSKGEVDYAKIEELVEWHVEQATDCLVPCGTTGESPTLTHEEHDGAVDAVIKAASGRIKVLAGAGSNATREALRLCRHAESAGADGVLVITPYYNKPTQEGLYRHFRAVAEAVGIPVVMYNVPGRTGVSIAPETVARLASLKNIVAVKEASGSLDQASAIVSSCDVTVLSGDDSLTLPIMSVGGKGIISVVANIVPRDMKAMVEAYNAGDTAGAAERHKKLFPLCRAMFYETNPIPIKTAMRMLGRLNGEMRLPLCDMSKANEARLHKALEDYGLLD
jgi:4-hydroxy-tetrahydrodipicolinate synthase